MIVKNEKVFDRPHTHRKQTANNNKRVEESARAICDEMKPLIINFNIL